MSPTAHKTSYTDAEVGNIHNPSPQKTGEASATTWGPPPITPGTSEPVTHPLAQHLPDDGELYPPTEKRSSQKYHPAPGRVAIHPGMPPDDANHTGTGHAITKKTAGGPPNRWGYGLLIALVVITGIGSALAYVLTRPQPQLSLTSIYHVGNRPAGSIGTPFHISGQTFASSSTIIFLLDEKQISKSPRLISDASGTFSANLSVTSFWPLGKHTLTAQDANNNHSQSGVVIAIVQPGQAHTPGPLGAPADDARFTTNASITGLSEENKGSFTGSEKLIVHDNSVCKPDDTGKPHHSSTTTSNGIPLTEEMTTTCAGTYKGGTITYTQTLLAAVIVLNDNGTPITCHLTKPGPEEHLTGHFNAQRIFRGTVSYSSFPSTDFSCTTGSEAPFQFSFYGGTGTWTGPATFN